MQLQEKKLIIFDLDGTLIDSAPDLALALNFMLSSLGRSTFSLEEIHNWVGNGAQTLVLRALCAKRDVQNEPYPEDFEKALQLFLDFYAQNSCVKTATYPGVVESLSVLQERGYILAIVTNKPVAFVQTILVTLKIAQYFTYHIGGDSLEEKKPHPAPLLHVCKHLGFSIKESVMVGDSKNDILAAQHAPMDVIGVSYGYNYAEDIADYKPNVVIDSMLEILEIIV